MSTNAGTNASPDKALFAQNGMAAGATGHWFSVVNDGVTHIPLSIQVTGTATVSVEGRITSADASTPITSTTASTGVMVGRFPQMRVVVSGVSGAPNVRVSLGASKITDTGA